MTDEPEEEWRRLWYDPETPPYEVLHISMHTPATGRYSTVYAVYYRNYRGVRVYCVAATDELGAFVVGTEILKSLKAITDRRKERMK